MAKRLLKSRVTAQKADEGNQSVLPWARIATTRAERLGYCLLPQFYEQLQSRYSHEYSELKIFKQYIEKNHQGIHHQAYSMNQTNVKLYKYIFYGFAMIFAVLGCFVMTTTITTLTYAFLNLSSVIKILMTLVCALFSLTSLVIAVTMYPEREILSYYTRSALARIAKHYAGKRMTMGIARFFPFFGDSQQASLLKSLYYETCNAVHEYREETMHTVREIHATTSISFSTKEILYNQALADFNDKLTRLIHTFKCTLSS